MHTLDEDTLTPAVIARHAMAGDERLREVMTSLVQHLHAFTREVRLAEDEWRSVLAFLDDAGRHQGFAPLSDALGVSALVMAQNHRHPPGCTEASATAFIAEGPGTVACRLHGRVLDLHSEPIPGAVVHAGEPLQARARSDDKGRFTLETRVSEPAPADASSPVGRLLHRLGRCTVRPLHLPVAIVAPGCVALHTQLFRRGDPQLDHDPAFGPRRTLLADWQRDDSGGRTRYTLGFDFILQRAP